MDDNGPSLPLNALHIMWKNLIINRLHMFFNAVAISAVFYYRATTLRRITHTKETPILPYVLLFFSEIVLTFIWVLHQAYRWRPVTRTVYPDRLPRGDDGNKLPPLDVFICTADPSKEPSLGVMNTVISAMALDYPPDKLAVYLQDDGGSHVTLGAMREAWRFARWWVPFVRKYGVKIGCPEAYFAAEEDFNSSSTQLAAEKKIIQKRYDEFREAIEKISVNAKGSVSSNHPSVTEVMMDENNDFDLKEMPLLVYVAREKRPGHPHHFKGGALNVLLRVSALISNAPYFLVLDCDMYCYDPSSARQAMCFYLDPKISSKIGWVQFPQKFRDLSEHDIYGGSLSFIWREGLGSDGLTGPNIYGCNFFMSRTAIYGTEKIQKGFDLTQLKKTFGSSNEFVKSIFRSYKPQLSEDRKPSAALDNELQLLASCTYDNRTEWGEKVGYRYFTVVEDSITSLVLHCKGWISVFIDPERPCFLGSSPTNLNDVLVQQTRWSFGLMQIALSRFSPLIYGPLKMSILRSLCYGSLALDSLYSLGFYGLAVIPQICLLYGIPLYPSVSEPMFIAFAFIFISSQLKHVEEVVSYGDSFMTALYEMRMWMMKSGSCYFYGVLNAILDKFALHKADFTLTNKAVDDEQARLLQQGIYDFQTSPPLLAPLCVMYIINLAACVVGISRAFHGKDEFLAQTVISLFGVIVNYHLLEGMVLRRDNGRISPFVTVSSVALSAVVLCCGYLLLLY
ncbi:hypothetical protein CASFOL_029942 [Castilleja foliolosa]|uniref:Cellulose synthase-like protein G2 n=1 Tax=Castilleja foliolosa TaxID=1961234 RepID=A0ABD3C9B9_9LAMI